MEFLKQLKHGVANITTMLIEKFGKKRLMVAGTVIAVLLVGSVSFAAVVTSGEHSASDAEKVQKTSTGTSDESNKDSTEDTVTVETTEETEPEVVVDEDGYTYTDEEKTMYATTTVNVRQKANGESEKLGSLSAGDEVAVTGYCNETGWIRITYNDGAGYVSPDYLSDEKPEVTTTATSTGSGSSSKSSGSSSGSSASTTGTTSTSSGAYFDSSKARALFDKVNADRTSGGASSLNWSDSLYNFAMQRCQAIVSDYSHNGATYGENIYKSYSSDPNEWYTAFRNSSGHYNNYMSTSYNEGAVGAYYCNGCWYICEVFHFDHSSPDLVIHRITTTSGIVVCATQGGEYYCEDGGTDEAHMAAIEEARQLYGY